MFLYYYDKKLHSNLKTFSVSTIIRQPSSSILLPLLLFPRNKISKDNPPRRLAPCRLDFDTPLSSTTTLPQSPLPSRRHSWLPSTNRPYFTLASLHFLSPLPFVFPHSPPPSLSPLFPLLLYMPTICPYTCYVGLHCTISTYTGFAILATPRFRYRCSAMLTLKMKKIEETVTFMLMSGRSGEPLTSSNAASNHVDVRPTSQRRPVILQLCFCSPDNRHTRNFVCDDGDLVRGRSQATRKLGRGPLSDSGGNLVESSEGMSELFNQAFGKVFTKENLSDIKKVKVAHTRLPSVGFRS